MRFRRCCFKAFLDAQHRLESVKISVSSYQRFSVKRLKRAGGFSTRMKLAFKPKEPWQPPGASGDRRSKYPPMGGMDE